MNNFKNAEKKIIKLGEEVPIKLLFSEFIGTALLLSLGLSIVIVDFGHNSPIVNWIPSIIERRALTGFAFGAVGAAITFSPVGKVSGAHINPSVSLAFLLEKKIHFKLFLGYVIAQLLGAVVGGIPLLLFGGMGKTLSYGATQVGPQGPYVAIIGETIATFCLIMGLFIFLGSHTLRRFTPLILPPLFAIMVTLEAGISGTSTNLARSLGPAVVGDYWSGFYVYVIGPFLGVFIAIATRKMKLFRSFEIEVAKLYRFSKDPYHVLGKSPFE